MKFYDVKNKAHYIATVEFRKEYNDWAIVWNDKPADFQVWNTFSWRYHIKEISDKEKETLLKAGFELLDENGKRIE